MQKPIAILCGISRAYQHFSPRGDAFGGLPEGRGFSPAETAAPALCSSRAPHSLRPQAVGGAGLGNNSDGPVTAGLKPRPSEPVVRNAGYRKGGALQAAEKRFNAVILSAAKDPCI
jgi:hypothetical protein